MVKEYWTVKEVIEIIEIDEDFITDLEREEIICPTCPEGNSSKRYSASDMDRLHLAKTLMEEMEVNLPGVDIILRMRQDMINMRRQFDRILEDMARHIKETFGKDL